MSATSQKLPLSPKVRVRTGSGRPAYSPARSRANAPDGIDGSGPIYEALSENDSEAYVNPDNMDDPEGRHLSLSQVEVYESPPRKSSAQDYVSPIAHNPLHDSANPVHYGVVPPPADGLARRKHQGAESIFWEKFCVGSRKVRESIVGFPSLR